MKYRIHRGGDAYTPENTMSAFVDALKIGFDQIETDPRFTKDGKIVLLHDETINRTCRNPDGTPIKEKLYVSDLTYDELCRYDAGIHKGDRFAGEKVPLLSQLLEVAENSSTVIALDKKIQDDRLDELFDIVEKYNTKVSFSVKDEERTKKILERFPNALIDYDGNTTEEDLKKITSLVKHENLLIWLYLDTPNFAWLTDRYKASEENCERVKKYARLGIANIMNPYDVHTALGFEPYIIEV